MKLLAIRGVFKRFPGSVLCGNTGVTLLLLYVLGLASPLVASAQEPIDVSLGAALACGTDTDFESTIFRQDHLIVATSPADVDCQIPNEAGRQLRAVWVRMTNINGFSNETVCNVESNHPISNRVNQSAPVSAPVGNERTNLKLAVPRPISSTGYWTINCKLEQGSVLRGFRYVYR